MNHPMSQPMRYYTTSRTTDYDVSSNVVVHKSTWPEKKRLCPVIDVRNVAWYLTTAFGLLLAVVGIVLFGFAFSQFQYERQQHRKTASAQRACYRRIARLSFGETYDPNTHTFAFDVAGGRTYRGALVPKVSACALRYWEHLSASIPEASEASEADANYLLGAVMDDDDDP